MGRMKESGRFIVEPLGYASALPFDEPPRRLEEALGNAQAILAAERKAREERQKRIQAAMDRMVGEPPRHE